MHIPSAILGRPIGRMYNNKFFHKTMVTQITQPPYHTSHISTPYIGGQSSMGGQPSVGGQPFVTGKLFTEGKATWLQHQQAWGKTSLVSPSIPTTIGLYPRHPYKRVVNPLWDQPNPVGILLQGTMPFQSIKPTIPMQHSLQSQYMGDPLGQPHHIGGPSGQF
jgi:hypothetical protein